MNQLVRIVFLLFVPAIWREVETAPRNNLITGICRINVNRNLGPTQPLLIHPNTSEFFYPQDSRGIIFMNRTEDLVIFCNDRFQAPPLDAGLLKATCDSRSNFFVGNIRHEFSEINCLEFPKHVARRIPGMTCFGQSSAVEIGFDIGNKFLRIMLLCFDEIVERTHYVYYKMTPANSAFQRGQDRINFIKGAFFGNKNMDRIFSRSQQRDTIAGIVGSRELADKYINNQHFLSRGHLAARADFVFGSQQRATFYYVNAAPQWQIFNSMNWESLEHSVRVMVGKRNINLEVYTGTFGTATLKDANGREHEIFLSVNRTSRSIPIPRYYYKILVNNEENSGIVFIGINNPHLTLEEIKKDYIICGDVSSMINYVSWEKDDITNGFMFACRVKEFLKIVPHVALNLIERLLV